MGRTLLIVDDHEAFRLSARRLLESEGFTVVGEAGTGAAALDAVVALRPEVVLLDVQLPDVDGFEVARRIARAGNAPAVVLTSSRDASSYGASLDRAPAIGFIDKVDLSGRAVAAMVKEAR